MPKNMDQKLLNTQKKNWTEEKEKEYISQLKELHSKREEEDEVDKELVNGVFIPKKLLNSDSNRSCPVCKTYSFKSNDTLYMTKFDCCEKCYIKWVEDREERWLKGWRPEGTKNENL